MATITDTQLQFSSDNISTGNYHFPTGTVSLFFLSSAPSEWSQVTTQNNKAFRVVSGTGGGTGGTNTFTGCFGSSRPLSANFVCTINASEVGNTSLDTNTIASHDHPIGNGPGKTVGASFPRTGALTVRQGNGASGTYGNGGAHGHPHSASANGSFDTTIDFEVQYVDIILCSYSGT